VRGSFGLVYSSNCECLETALIPSAQSSTTEPTTDNIREWNAVIREFLSTAGLAQAVRGFDADMVVMNSVFERDVIPGALNTLLDSLAVSYAFQPAGLHGVFAYISSL
jgi:hypothetical protein